MDTAQPSATAGEDAGAAALALCSKEMLPENTKKWEESGPSHLHINHFSLHWQLLPRGLCAELQKREPDGTCNATRENTF